MAEESGPKEVSLEEQRMSAEELSAAEDKALNDLLGGGNPEVAAADIAAFVPGSEGAPPIERVQPEQAPESAPVAAPEQATEQPTVDEERRLAEARIRQDGGWTAEDLALLPRERVMVISGHRQKNQQDVNAAFAELRQLRESGVPAGERTAGEKEAEAPLTSSVEALATELALDDEGTKLLAQSHREALKPLQDKLAAQTQAAEDQALATQRIEADLARRDLVERFPQLSDAQGPDYQRVLATVDTLKLSPVNQGKPMKEILESAALITFADQIKTEASKALEERRKARSNGQPLVSTSELPDKPDASEVMTYEQRESAALSALMGVDGTYDERFKRAQEFGGRQR